MIPFLPYLLPYIVNRYTIGGLVGFGLMLGAYAKGYMDAREKCQDNALKSQIASMQRDMDAWKAADAVEAMLHAQVEAENRELEQRVSDYERELATRPEPRCSLDQRDVDRLRGIGR